MPNISLRQIKTNTRQAKQLLFIHICNNTSIITVHVNCSATMSPLTLTNHLKNSYKISFKVVQEQVVGQTHKHKKHKYKRNSITLIFQYSNIIIIIGTFKYPIYVIFVLCVVSLGNSQESSQIKPIIMTVQLNLFVPIQNISYQVAE